MLDDYLFDVLLVNGLLLMVLVDRVMEVGWEGSEWNIGFDKSDWVSFGLLESDS